MPEMTETRTSGRKHKKKKNKESHNAVERHRKEKINAGINRIGNLLPCSQALKQSKNMILDQAFRYITELKRQNDKMLLEGGNKVQAQEICRLRKQLEEMRKESARYIELLKAHDISISEDPTIHWHGRQRSTKVAKVTPTHQLKNEILIHTNGNVIRPAAKDNSPRKQSKETLILQSPSEAGTRLKINGAVVQVNTASSTPSLLSGTAVRPTQSMPGQIVPEQCVVETLPVSTTLPPSVSYITLTIPRVTTTLPEPPQPATSLRPLSITTSSISELSTDSTPLPFSSLKTLPETVSRSSCSDVYSLVTQDNAIRTLSYTTVSASQALLRAGTASSTQTTWTTLQMAGNTVQPLCQSLPTPEISNTTQSVQQLTICSSGNKSSAQPIQIQMQPPVPVQPSPITGQIQMQSIQRPTQLQPSNLNHPQPQSVLAPQPQCTVLPQSAVVAHPVVSQSAVLQPASLVAHPPAAIIPQPALMPQPQTAVLPLLQTMQLLHVNPTGATASGVTAPQNTNNPSVVILQQANPCPTPLVREEITNPTSCQHIVIIQAPNQTAPAPQNAQVGLVSAALPTPVPAVSTQIAVTTSSVAATSLQTVGGKQLVHILPRPKMICAPKRSSSPPVSSAPQTITVNGQMFALQPVKTCDTSSSQSSQRTLQLVHPTTTEEPTTNVALNSLGALSSLNQSISQGIPLNISNQNNVQSPTDPSPVVQQQQPPALVTVTGSNLALPVQQVQAPCLNPVKKRPVVKASNVLGRKPCTVYTVKRPPLNRTKPAKKKALKQGQSAAAVAAKAVEAAGECQAAQATVAQVVLPSRLNVDIATSPTIVTTTTINSVKMKENLISTQNSQNTMMCISSREAPVVSQSSTQSKTSVSDVASVSGNMSVSGITAAHSDTVSETTVRPPVNAAVAMERKTALVTNFNPTVTKASVTDVKLTTTSTDVRSDCSNNSRQCRLVLSDTNDTVAQNDCISVPATCLTAVCTRSVTVSEPHISNQITHQSGIHHSQSSNGKYPLPSTKSETQSIVSISASTAVPLSSATNLSAAESSVSVSTSLEFRKRDTVGRASTQQIDISMSNPSPCHPTEVKPPQASVRDREAQEESPTAAAEKAVLIAVASDPPSRKDFSLPQHVYPHFDDETMEHPATSSRQTDSPMSAATGAGRGFSVASMLPQGHGISASSGSFSTFTFTSEQADMLALAMLEQDSPGRRSGCSGESVLSTNPRTAAWDSPKTPPTTTSKERSSASQPSKMGKPINTVTGKTAVQISARGPVLEATTDTTGTRHPQNIPYSQSLSQVQSQSPSQSGTVVSLSVNNLIRPSSSQQPYSGSPNVVSQQGSVPSPVGSLSHISQPPNNALSPCSGVAQINEYMPIKSALMRAQAVAAAGERHVKNISKRQAQEEVMMNTGKRPKPCPAPSNVVGRMEVKATDHSHVMMGQLPPSSSAIMTRNTSEGGGPLFSTNSFMSSVARTTDGHCPPQGPPDQNQPGVLHLPQGHAQHIASQSAQHLGGNMYMKQQQQEQQRQHLYHLQHHLTQPDPAQRHSLHQRALQQQQEQQHVQKKRGLLRSSQSGSPASLQQKQHHLEKSGVQQQQQHPHQQQTQHQQHTQQQPHQQSQPSQHPQSHPQQHQQQTHQHQQQQLQQQQSSHSRHQQHLQQQIQQQHFRHQEKSCEAQTAGPRAHHNSHLPQQEHLKPGQDHNGMQRLMNTRNLEQQLISPSTNPVSRPSELSCAPSRQERHRVSNYSAEALIGKSSSSNEQRMGLHLLPGRGTTQEQPDLRGYLDTSRGKASIAHNPQNCLSVDHPGPAEVQRVPDCTPFKTLGGGGVHQLSGFEAQVSRGGDMAPKSVPSSQRGPQGQQQGGFRMGVGPPGDGRNRGGYSGTHPGSQVVQAGPGLPREQDGCHHSFMQSLLSSHLPEQSNHQRAVQCCPPVSMEYNCVPGNSAGDMQGKATSPSVAQTQKAQAMRLGEGNKAHISQVSSNMHGSPAMRAGLPHPPTRHSSSEPGRSTAPSRAPPVVSQRSRHTAQDAQPPKMRPGDRPRSGTLRPSVPFEPEGHLPLPSGGGVLLSRPQSGGEVRRSSIVRFMADSAQPPTDNNLVPDQHITQNFGFPFIGEGGMNPPPPINTNSTFIPPVSQPSASRTPTLLPVEPQNSLPSFYPSYSPAAHPSLPSDIPLQYFPNQMFTSPTADKGSAPPLNNRFGSILSPPRPVGFGQASFPLLPDMPPMPIANSSGITPHISNFSLTSLFPEIATAMPTDGSAMPMSPLLSLSNTSSADSGKQPNRPAHNISHILGHDGSSAV